MKILHVVDYLMPQIGYQEFLLPKWNARHGHETHIVCADRYTPIPDYEKVWGKVLGPRICGPKEETIEAIRIVRLKTLECLRRPFLLGLEKTIRQINPHVIWVHGTASPSAFRVSLFCRKAGIPLLMDNHQHFIASRQGALGNAYYGILKFLSRSILEKTAYRFVGLADECCEFMHSRQGLPSEKMTVVPYGVDTDLFRFSVDARNRIRKEKGIDPDTLLVMQTGKLDDTRKPYWLAEAMSPLLQKAKKLALLYVGSASETEMRNLKSVFENAGVAAKVYFNDFVPQEKLPGYYSASDLCVYPDYCSLSCLEAASCGSAVIVNDLPAGIERENKGACITYKRGDIPDLRNKLSSLLEDPSRLSLQKEKGREAVLKNYSYDFLAKQAETLMESAIRSRKPL